MPVYAICKEYKNCEVQRERCEWKTTQDVNHVHLDFDVHGEIPFRCNRSGIETSLVDWEDIK